MTPQAAHIFSAKDTSSAGEFLRDLRNTTPPTDDAAYFARRIVRSALVGSSSQHYFFSDEDGRFFGYLISMTPLAMNAKSQYLRFYGSTDSDNFNRLAEHATTKARVMELDELFIELADSDRITSEDIERHGFCKCLSEQFISIPMNLYESVGRSLRSDLVAVDFQEALVRPALVESLCGLYRSGFKDVPVCLPTGDISSSFIIGEFSDPDMLPLCSFVVTADDDAIAFIQVVDRETVKGRTATVELAIVKGGWRDLRIGRYLIEAALSAIKERGYRDVLMLVDDSNQPMLRMCAGFGGRVVDRLSSYKLSI
ncbi:GNAT family N-acetyltransferase [Mesorhizobium sp. VK22B]|uniref:GNAT family N-acetyltransferase n=1 Tax=Mesorhizobium captivum TaxID=3072319 RepID=A0ABU4Z8R6_9HYPH|nr:MULTISPECIES: GNAT family N-acetyltransferase [unclassified Mesorhizobium]MDX8495306.1 GNAT family N-acetyltransferase [Mesorhizobium sp. VK22B]MDX8508713.1 GNAT family N-acetyltransferase [Mesorhizobium sp. VK22E]